MQGPATCAIHLLCRFGTCHTDVFHHLDEGVVTLRQVGNLSRPVVHLDIDVGGVLGVPGRILTGVGVPQALQVGRLGARL